MSLKQKFVPVSGALSSVEGTHADVSATFKLKKILGLPKMIGLLIFAVILSLSATGSAIAVGPPTCGGPGDPCPVVPRLIKDSISPIRNNPVTTWVLETSVPTTDFTADDITATNATVTLSGSGTNYTATVTAIAEGEITVQVKANSFSSADGTFNTASGTEHRYYYDTIRPTATLGALRGPDASNKFKSTLILSEPVRQFNKSDLYCKTCFVREITGSGPEYEVTIESEVRFNQGETGTILLSLVTGAIVDLAGNGMITLPEPVTYTVEDTSPTATIASLEAFEDIVLIKGQSVQDILITLSDPSTDFTPEDIEAANATVTLSQLTNASYSATLTPLADGVATIQVKANSFSNGDGVFNKKPSNREVVVADLTPPTITLSAFSEPVDGKITTTITLSEDSRNFGADDLNVTNGTVSVSGRRSKYEATITPIREGFINAQVAGGKFSDEAGNLNEGASNFISTLFDPTPPTVTIAEFEGPTADGKYTAAITLSEPAFEFFGEGGQIPTFTVEDLDVTNGTATLTGSDTSYVATVTPTGGAEIALQVKAGSISDPGGNVNAEASNRITVIADSTPPSVVISSGATDPVNGAFSVTFTFSEGVTSFASGDITVGNGSVINFSVVSSSVYIATITPAADGPVTVDVGAAVAQDAAGNANTAAAGYSINSDVTAPTAEITSGATDPVSGSFTVTVTFSEVVTGFDLNDLTVGNGTASDLGSTSANVYTATITPAADGPVTVDVAAAAAQDAAGNANVAATQFSITNDVKAPTVAITTSATDPVSGAFTVFFTFSEGVTEFGLDDITVDNGAASALESTSASVYAATITPVADGPVTVDVAAEAAQDVAGNGNMAATQFSIMNDGTAPTVILSTATAEVTGPFTITATFSEVVRGFTADDISIGNGAISDFSGSDMVFTATVTPVTIGEIVMSIAAGAADDLAGNASAGATLTTTAGGGDVLVALEVTTAVLDASTVGTEFTLSNPGTQPIFFVASSNQPWAEVTPLSGKIDSLSNLEFDIQLNDLIDQLSPGTYVATVTVEVVDAPSAAAGSGTTKSTARRILAEVPITVEVEERFGDFELIVLTPTGPSTGASFQYSSDIAGLNGLSVSTNSGERRESLTDVLQGTYRLEQSIPEGYSLNSITCTGDRDGGTIVDLDTGAVDIDLDASENISCIFENVRDDDAIRTATQRAIRNFMARRGDRVLAAAPDLSNRFAERRRSEGGQFVASGSELRTNMDFQTSLSGFRNRAIDNEAGPSTELTNPYSSNWDLWASAEYARYDDDRVESGVDGKFFAAQFGADYLLKNNLIVGAMVQYDWMSETDKELAVGVGAQRGAEVDGEGLMGGPYLVWQPKDQLTIDVMGLWGSSDNTVNPLGYYSDEFETDRFMVRANVTGEFASGPWRLRPQVSLAHYQDKQDEYIDSLGIDIPEQVVSIGRLRAGPEVVWTHQTDKGSQFEIGGSIRAVWNYNGAGLMDPTGRIASGSDSVRADGDISIGTRFANGVSLRAKAGFDGIGKGDFSARSGRLEVVFPFGGKSSNGSKLGANPLEQAGFHRACEADAYLQSFNVSPPAACSGAPRTNLLDTNIAMMAPR